MIKINDKNNGIYFINQYEKEIVDYINQNNISRIIFSSEYTNKETEIGFLLKTKSIESIIITSLIKIDLEILYKLKIKELLISIGEYGIDFSKLNNIEYADLIYNKKINFKGISNSFKKLIIRKFKQKQFDECFDENNITDLWIAQSQLVSLKGLEKFSHIEKLRIALSPQLVDITALEYSNNLKHLELDSCKLLTDLSVLKKLINVEEINIYNIGSIDTTAYFKNLSKLKTLFLRGNTKIFKQDKNDISHIEKVVIADMDLIIGCQ